MKATLWIEGGRLLIRSDFSRSFVDELKMLVPARHRQWKPKPDLVWSVDPSYLDDVHALCEKYYQVTVVGDQPATPTVALTCDPYSVFCRYASEKTLKTFYKAIVLELHPDKGGDARQMAEVNAAWNAIKQQRSFR